MNVLASIVGLVLLCNLVICVQGQQAYNDAKARRYTLFASAAYCDVGDIQSWTCRWCTQAPGFEVSAVMSNSTVDSVGFVGYDKTNGEVVVVYRGTQPTDILNWIQDIKLAKTTPAFAPNVLVHLGFYESYQSLQSQTYQAVERLLTTYPGAPLVVVGHSLGAAIAVLFAADFSSLYGDINVWTMGQPRVGNSAFASWYKEQSGIVTTWRIVNDDDLVPHLPGEIFGFYHIPTEVWYTSNTNYRICDSSGEDPSCSDSVPLAASVYDHTHYFGYEQLCF